MSIVTMPVSSLLRKDNADWDQMHPGCDRCGEKYEVHRWLDTNKYQARHDHAGCRGRIIFNTLQVLQWKLEDEQTDDIIKSMIEVHDKPITFIDDNDIIIDGLHRLAVAHFVFKMNRVLVKTGAIEHSQDSGQWYYGNEILV